MRIVFGVVLLFGLSTGALAQREATVSGTVTDITGGVLPGAEVTAIHEPTDEVTTGFTDGTGKYQLTGLQPGSYTLTVSMPGFQTGTHINVELTSDQPALLDFVLELEAVDTTLVVVGSRAKPRSVTESTVPVDVIRTEDFTSQGSSDLANQLRTVVPPSA